MYIFLSVVAVQTVFLRHAHLYLTNEMNEDKSPLRTNHSNCLTEIATIQAASIDRATSLKIKSGRNCLATIKRARPKQMIIIDCSAEKEDQAVCSEIGNT